MNRRELKVAAAELRDLATAYAKLAVTTNNFTRRRRDAVAAACETADEMSSLSRVFATMVDALEAATRQGDTATVAASFLAVAGTEEAGQSAHDRARQLVDRAYDMAMIASSRILTALLESRLEYSLTVAPRPAAGSHHERPKAATSAVEHHGPLLQMPRALVSAKHSSKFRGFLSSRGGGLVVLKQTTTGSIASNKVFPFGVSEPRLVAEEAAVAPVWFLTGAVLCPGDLTREVARIASDKPEVTFEFLASKRPLQRRWHTAEASVTLRVSPRLTTDTTAEIRFLRRWLAPRYNWLNLNAAGSITARVGNGGDGLVAKHTRAAGQWNEVLSTPSSSGDDRRCLAALLGVAKKVVGKPRLGSDDLIVMRAVFLASADDNIYRAEEQSKRAFLRTMGELLATAATVVVVVAGFGRARSLYHVDGVHTAAGEVELRVRGAPIRLRMGLTVKLFSKKDGRAKETTKFQPSLHAQQAGIAIALGGNEFTVQSVAAPQEGARPPPGVPVQHGSVVMRATDGGGKAGTVSVFVGGRPAVLQANFASRYSALTGDTGGGARGSTRGMFASLRLG